MNKVECRSGIIQTRGPNVKFKVRVVRRIWYK